MLRSPPGSLLYRRAGVREAEGRASGTRGEVAGRVSCIAYRRMPRLTTPNSVKHFAHHPTLLSRSNARLTNDPDKQGFHRMPIPKFLHHVQSRFAKAMYQSGFRPTTRPGLSTHRIQFPANRGSILLYH